MYPNITECLKIFSAYQSPHASVKKCVYDVYFYKLMNGSCQNEDYLSVGFEATAHIFK